MMEISNAISSNGDLSVSGAKTQKQNKVQEQVKYYNPFSRDC